VTELKEDSDKADICGRCFSRHDAKAVASNEMELSEQKMRLLDSNDHDRLDFADVEQNTDHNPLSNCKGTVRRGWLKQKWRDTNWRDLVAAAILIGVVYGALVYTLGSRARKSPRRAPYIAALRVLVAGDSISQGSESMHTWRYRLWEWFQANNVTVAFVGPFHRTRLQQPDLATEVPLLAHSSDEFDGPTAMNGGYALDIEPEFLYTGSAHFAIWGGEIAQNLNIISQQIRDY
jgi:hypothetical protein